jgi:hypothetical protein
MHFLDVGGLAKDGAQLALGLSPLTLLSGHGLTALGLSLLNVAVLAAIRVYDARLRSRERLEMARLRLQLEAARGNSDAHLSVGRYDDPIEPR